MLIGKKTYIPVEVCYKDEQLFHPVQRNAWKIWHCISIDDFVLSRATGFCSTSDQFHYLWGIHCFGNGTRQCSIVSIKKCTHSFLLPIYIVRFRPAISSLASVFSMSSICCISTTVSIVWLGDIFGVVGTTWQSVVFDFSLRERFLLISNVPTHPYSKTKRWRVNCCNYFS